MTPKTKSDIYTHVTSLLNDIQIDTTLFDTLLDTAQMRLEGLRPWVILRAADATQSVSAGDTSGKAMPTDFREWYEEAPIQLLDAQLNPLPLVEVPFSDRYVYKNSNGRFCADYINNLVYILGNIQQPYTIYQSYIKESTPISALATNTWIFPARFHAILGLMIAEMWKNGIDYDVISNIQANQQGSQASLILNEMTRWDNRLQINMTRGVDVSNNLNAFNTGIMNGTNIL